MFESWNQKKKSSKNDKQQKIEIYVDNRRFPPETEKENM